MGKKRYYPTVDASTGEMKMYFGEWIADGIADKIQGSPNLIFKGFDEEKAAEEFLEAGYIERKDKNLNTTDEINEEIENRKTTLDDYQAIIVTDGSYMEATHPEVTGYGWIGILKDKEIEENGVTTDDKFVSMKNVGGEILAVEQGIKWSLENNIQRLDIYCDFAGLASWAYGYRTNTPATEDYHKLLEAAHKKMKIVFHKINSHTGVTYNEKADSLAKKAITNK